MTAESGSNGDFLGREYDTLKTELLEAVKETRVLERFALAVTAAIWSWLAANSAPNDVVWWAPVVLVAFFYLRVKALEVHIDDIGRYLARVEKRLAPAFLGFEHRFAHSGDKVFKRYSAEIFWWGLLVATSVGPFVLAPVEPFVLPPNGFAEWVVGVGLSICAAAAMVVLWIAVKRVLRRRDLMDRDEECLRAVNIGIGNAEARGDAAYFEDLLAPVFAMRRAGGTGTTDRGGFIATVKSSAERETEIESVTFLPSDRALVTCVVAMQTTEGRKRFHNARLFARDASDKPWKLLAWANELLR